MTKDKKRLLIVSGVVLVAIILVLLFGRKGTVKQIIQEAANSLPFTIPGLNSDGSNINVGDSVVNMTFGGSDFSPWVPPNFDNNVQGYQSVDRDGSPTIMPPFGSAPLGASGCGCCGNSISQTPQSRVAFSSSNGTNSPPINLPFVYGR